MSQIEDRLLDHPARGLLRGLGAFLDQLQDEQRDQIEELRPGALKRGSLAVQHIEGLIAAANPLLVPPHALGQMEEPLRRALDASEALPADSAQAANFDGAIEDLVASSQLLAATVCLPEKISKAAAGSFGSALYDRAQSLKAEVEAIRGETQDLATEIQRLDAEGKEAFGQRRSDLQGEFDRVAEAVKTEQGRLDQLVPQFEKQFAEAQSGWADEWQELKKRVEEKATSEEEQLKARASEAATALSDQADGVLNEVREVRDRVVDLYRVIGDTGTAGAFAGEADEQKKAADRWRRVAVAGAILTILLAIGAVIFSTIDDGGSSTSHLASLLVAVAAGGLTGYAARQSGHHRDREDETRRLELELTAFGPFINDLEHPGEARAAYAKRLFKGAERQPNGEATISKDQVTLLQTLVESLIKVRG